jgi:hypothetical protein
MRRTIRPLGALVFLLGCNQHGANGGPHGDGGAQDLSAEVVPPDLGPAPDLVFVPRDGAACVPPTSLTISPANLMDTATAGASYSRTFTVTANYAGMPSADVTSQSYLTSSDPTLGTFTGGTLSWNGNHGGSVTIAAKQCGVSASTTFMLNVAASFATPGTDPNAGMTAFGGPASTNAGCAPALVYPPDGVLIPPNTNLLEVHFQKGGNNLFEISFTNMVTNVKVYTKCSDTMSADNGLAVGTTGCIFSLSQAEWDFIARTNADRDPVTVGVRGVGCDGSNVAAGTTRQISFARDDLVGTLYYWSSIRVGTGGSSYSGGVFRYDFGVRGQSATPVLTPDSAANPNHLCIGCHDVSRDGRQMVFDFDDNDADDEYHDIFTDAYDIIQQKPAVAIIKGNTATFPPGYHTWNRETTQFLLSDGPSNSATPPGAFERVSPSGMKLGYAQSGTLRGTTPDWAPDDSQVVFSVPPNLQVNPPNAGYWMHARGPADDLWFAGASLYVAPWNAPNNTLGAATLLLDASGSTKNYYYPSFSPEGSLISFDYAPSGANFHNALARVQLIAAGQASPKALDLARANDTGSLTNSWARWSPFVQMYKGMPLLWMTFSSTRDYGLRIKNTGASNCYPTESPIMPFFTAPPTGGCTRPQIWMAAIRLDANMVKAGTDVSWPAFWLPFQDLGRNNHLAQWAQKSFTGPCKTAGDCAVGQCCDNGGCTTCAPPPPPPMSCSADPNCGPGQCCVAGSCGVCAPPDGGTTGCNTCIDCNGQACLNGACGACTDSTQCCAPLVCVEGQCVTVVQ